MIKRIIQDQIEEKFFKGKAIIILGPRQVGKTTLVKKICNENSEIAQYLNADESDIRDIFNNATSTRLKSVIGNKKLIVIDEAQRIDNIGIAVKLIVDNFSDIQIIITGSSSFELKNKFNEPLTGRKYVFKLFPLSFSEMVNHTSIIEENRMIENRLIYGYYPEVLNKPNEQKEILNLLAESYLFKDILSTGLLKKTDVLEKLLQALGLQVGSEVKYNELAQLIGVDNQTIERYIDILEKSFIVFRLQSFSRNLSNEIKKGKKIYFYDNGILNSVIKNFNSVNLRNNIGGLWENFLVSERMKKNSYNNMYLNTYFWRTHTQQEIDYIEEYDGKITGYEFKWNNTKKIKIPSIFINNYKNSEIIKINRENYSGFLL